MHSYWYYLTHRNIAILLIHVIQIQEIGPLQYNQACFQNMYDSFLTTWPRVTHQNKIFDLTLLTFTMAVLGSIDLNNFFRIFRTSSKGSVC